MHLLASLLSSLLLLFSGAAPVLGGTGVTASATPLGDQFIGKTTLEKASIKGDALVATQYSGTYTDTTYGLTIEVTSITKIDDGVQIQARAWKGTDQIGFGDGTVDIERFNVHNPPIMVPDGTTHTVTEQISQGRTITAQADNFKEAPLAALQMMLAHTISVAGAPSKIIEPGKVGHTTDTYFPEAGTGAASFDGRLDYAVLATFATARAAANSSTAEQTAAGPSTCVLYSKNSGSNWDEWLRAEFLFNTASLPDTDVISSATMSLFGGGKNETIAGQAVGLVAVAPASNTTAATADYGTYGTTRYATDITLASFSTTAYNDFALNASGIAAVSLTGTTKIGTRFASDIDNVEPTAVLSDVAFAQVFFADNAGTTKDPQLVVVHAAATANTYNNSGGWFTVL